MAQCEAQRLCFTPVVFEAHGGEWGTSVRRVFDSIASRHTASGCRSKEVAGLRIAQRISSAIHMANSRAILKRLWPRDVEGPSIIDLEAADATSDVEA